MKNQIQQKSRLAKIVICVGFLCLASCTAQLVAKQESLLKKVAGEYETFADREWEFMQYKITHVTKEKRRPHRITKAFSFIWPSILVDLIASKHFLKKEPVRSPVDRSDLKLWATFFGVFGTWTLVNVYTMFCAYCDFVQNWPENKQYTPQCLHKLFDEFYVVYRRYGWLSYSFLKKYKQVSDIVHLALQNRFPEFKITQINTHNTHMDLPIPIYTTWF